MQQWCIDWVQLFGLILAPIIYNQKVWHSRNVEWLYSNYTVDGFIRLEGRMLCIWHKSKYVWILLNVSISVSIDKNSLRWLQTDICISRVPKSKSEHRVLKWECHEATLFVSKDTETVTHRVLMVSISDWHFAFGCGKFCSCSSKRDVSFHSSDFYSEFCQKTFRNCWNLILSGRKLSYTIHAIC